MWFHGVPTEISDIDLPCYMQKKLIETQENARNKIIKIRQAIANYPNTSLDEIEKEINELLYEVVEAEYYRKSKLPEEEKRFDKIRKFLAKVRFGVKKDESKTSTTTDNSND